MDVDVGVCNSHSPRGQISVNLRHNFSWAKLRAQPQRSSMFVRPRLTPLFSKPKTTLSDPLLRGPVFRSSHKTVRMTTKPNYVSPSVRPEGTSLKRKYRTSVLAYTASNDVLSKRSLSRRYSLIRLVTRFNQPRLHGQLPDRNHFSFLPPPLRETDSRIKLAQV